MNYSNIARNDDAPDDGLTDSQIDAISDAMEDSDKVWDWSSDLSGHQWLQIGQLIKDLPDSNPLRQSLWDYCQKDLGL